MLLGSRQFHPRAPGHSCGSLAAWVGTQIARAPGLDLGGEGGGLADDVAVELVVALSVDPDPHPFRVLVDLVILLGASGDEP